MFFASGRVHILIQWFEAETVRRAGIGARVDGGRTCGQAVVEILSADELGSNGCQVSELFSLAITRPIL